MPHIPLEDFFRKPERAIARLSPDGRHVAFLGRWERRMNLFVRQLETGEEHRLTDVARDIVQFVWASSERLAFVIDTEGDENWHVWSVDLAGGPPRNLTPLERVQARLLSDLKALDDVILVSLNDRDARLHDAWRINVATGERSLAAINPGSVSEWLADYSGRVRVAAAVEHTTTKIMARDNEQAPWRTILTCGMLDDITPLWFTADEQAVYAASNLGRPATAIVEIDLNDGRERGVVAEQDGVDLQELFVSERRRVPTHITVDAERTSFLCLDPAQARLQQIVDERLPGRVNRFTSSSRDERVWTLASYSDRHRGTAWLVDAEAGTMTQLFEVAPWLREDELCAMEPVSYRARDGRLIPGYLTRPLNTPGPLPLVVNPHGGPWHRDIWVLNPEVQLFANRGYAVLQMEFRGSTGYGRDHWQAGFGQWGLAMQDDVEDGVRWAVEQGIADPSRVAIYGGSYGGYATLSGITKTPTLYRCAICVVGISNIVTWMAAIPPYWELYRARVEVMVGDPERDRERLEATSPALHADRIQTPLLIAQGANDPRVKKAESEQMVEALHRRGVAVEYMLKEDEGHGFRNEENEIEFYRAAERFLGQHLTDSMR
jgi:dipeptidyl aminopeptidase/acylaminoacyl peptidase